LSRRASVDDLQQLQQQHDQQQYQHTPLELALELALASKSNAFDDRRALLSFVLQTLSSSKQAQALLSDNVLVRLVHLACQIGVDAAPLVQWFVSNRADLLGVRRGGVTPLYVSVERRHVELLSILLQAPSVRATIDVACSSSSSSSLIDGSGGSGLTALARAAQHMVDDDDDQSRLAVVEMLLDSGASTRLDPVLGGSQVGLCFCRVSRGTRRQLLFFFFFFFFFATNVSSF
jgi:hypothetical protein